MATLIIGNKSDKPERAVSAELANGFATKFQCGLIETSALDASNVDNAFETILREIVQTVIKLPEGDSMKYSFKGKTKKVVKSNTESVHENRHCLCCGN